MITPLSRAFLFNLESLFKKANELAQEASKKSFSSDVSKNAEEVSKTLGPWKSLISETSKRVGEIEDIRKKHGDGLIIALLGVLSAPIVRTAKEGQITPGLAAAAVASGMPLKLLELTGTAAMKTEAMFRAAAKVCEGKGVSKQALEVGISVNVECVRQKAIPKLFDSATSTVKILVAEEITLPSDPSQHAQAVSNLFSTSKEVKIPLKPTLMEGSLKVFGGIMTYASMCAVANSVVKTMSFNQEEVKLKLNLAIASVANAVMGLMETALKLVPVTCLGEVASALRKIVRNGGALLGGITGLIAAVWDVQKMLDSNQKHEYGLMIAYFVSAAAGITGASMCFASIAGYVPGYGWTLAVIGLVAGLVVDGLKLNDIQRLLERSCWGNGDYATFDLEKRDFAIARG